MYTEIIEPPKCGHPETSVRNIPPLKPEHPFRASSRKSPKGGAKIGFLKFFFFFLGGGGGGGGRCI